MRGGAAELPAPHVTQTREAGPWVPAWLRPVASPAATPGEGGSDLSANGRRPTSGWSKLLPPCEMTDRC